MKISELIEKLEEFKGKHGDLTVFFEGLNTPNQINLYGEDDGMDYAIIEEREYHGN